MSEKAYMFPSLEWMNAIVEKLNASDEYKKVAANYEGDIVLQVLPEPGILDEGLCMYANPYHGQIKDVQVLKSPEEKKPEFIITGPFTVWRDIAEGKLDSMQAVMKGKLKLTGSMAKLLKNIKAANVLLNTLKTIPTTFPG